MNCPTKRCLKKLEDRGTMYYCSIHDHLLEGEDVIIVWLEIAQENEGHHCRDCIHLKKDKISCKAFPEVIPEPFIMGIEKHKKKKYGQQNEIMFEARA
ncbi:MAG: hypothetical protein E3J56_15895 [Candidatus Aminicenantes bacterium]|nr:MAG: hypothetical protein E3J56_15895 [Candidatus Aminicenantes bacterium]